MSAFEHAVDTPFFLTEDDLAKMKKSESDQQSKELLSSHAGALIDGLTPEEVIEVLEDFFGEPSQFVDAGYVEMTDDNKVLVVRPASASPQWQPKEARDRLYIEARVRHMQFNDAKVLNDTNLRYPGIKVYCNVAAELCMGLLLDMRHGIALENLVEQMHSFLNEAEGIAHELLGERNELKQSAVACQ